MLETFGEYMYYLLSTPFKQVRKAGNQWYIYFKVTGRLFDKNKTMLRRAREEGMVKTASPRMLPLSSRLPLCFSRFSETATC